MDAAFKVSPDDPQGPAEAIQRATRGAVARLMREGQAVIDIVPTGSARAIGADSNNGVLAIERR